jgi:hypothetical protein
VSKLLFVVFIDQEYLGNVEYQQEKQTRDGPTVLLQRESGNLE